MLISSDTIASYRRDGVIHLPQVLDTATLDLAQRGFEWSVNHPTPSACQFYAAEGSNFYQDLCHPQAALTYRQLLEQSTLADLVAQLWGEQSVWFLYEQIFVKEGAETRRTPWHQDTPYLALEGEQIAVVWINFQAVEQSQSLEFVRGSHRQTLYNGSAFDDDDDTAPIYAHGLPRLPDIESERDNWDIVSWPIEPGDVVIFHPSTLHGGAPQAGLPRRTLSLRFFGPTATYAERPEPAPAPLTAGLHDALEYGQVFRHPAFPQVRPDARGFENIPADLGHDVALKSQMQSS